MTKDIEKLSTAGTSKRKNLKKMAIGAAYAVPVVAVFNMGDMTANAANTYNGGACVGNPGNDKCVGNAGENPSGNGFGSGSQGTSS
ncbi:MAG: hypothetical protein HOJ34_12825 [Kordiimonadaceae bacterium]|jgi:hypothetical protein|nr:hypothetical protein [Kordiimonadaceae bacterium]MBT6035166.1 hypothetical protein [Kordiimonadaceae bacterium]MBT6330655.1 hypothetical protein [Kordiimonadaceae bacterium]MBT7581391.1 hypothetical protein [Kordiimonadaceae bacterium]